MESEGWTLTNEPRLVGQHDWDICAWHPKWRKVILIEAKGDSKGKNYKTQKMHNSFYTMLGQILVRMDIKGNDKNCARIYAIAVPAHWEKTLRNKVKKMKFGWKLLKPKVFLIKEDNVKKSLIAIF